MKAIGKTRFILLVIAVGLATTAHSADQFPSKPLRMVVPAAPGGYADATARLVARKMSENLAQPVIIENRPGGDTVIGTRSVKDAPADGYTILFQSIGFTVNPSLKLEPGYDPIRDFAGVGPIHRFPSAMVTSNESPDRNLTDFIARAKKSSSKLTYASGGNGTPSHMATVAFLQATGLDLVHVPYKGVAATLPDVMSGRVDFVFEAVPTALPRIKSGKSKTLGVTSASRLAALPDVPTLAEQGVPNFSSYAWHGLLVRSSTPKAVIERLAQALKFAVTSPEISGRYRDEGAELMLMSPDEFDDFLRRDLASMSKLVDQLGLQKE